MSVARQAQLWQWAAVAYAVCAAAFIAFFPTVTVTEGVVSMLQLAGPVVLVPVLIPVLVTAVPAVLPWRKSLLAWILAGLIGVFVAVTAATLALLYLPAAAFSAVAGYLYHRAPIEDAPPPPDEGWPEIVRHVPK